MRVLQWIALVIFSWCAGYMLAMFWAALGLPPWFLFAALLVFGLLWLFNKFRNAPLEQSEWERRLLRKWGHTDTMRAIAHYRRKAQAQEQTEAQSDRHLV